MYSHIVPLLIRDDDDVESHLREVRIHEARVMGFRSEEEVVGTLDRGYESISTVGESTAVVSVSDIFCVFRPIDDLWVDPPISEPRIDGREAIVAICRISSVMIGSLIACEYDVPVMRGHIESRIIGIGSQGE